MRKFAKISAILVTFFFMFSFIGCSSDDDSSSDNDITTNGSSGSTSGSESGNNDLSGNSENDSEIENINLEGTYWICDKEKVYYHFESDTDLRYYVYNSTSGYWCKYEMTYKISGNKATLTTVYDEWEEITIGKGNTENVSVVYIFSGENMVEQYKDKDGNLTTRNFVKISSKP